MKRERKKYYIIQAVVGTSGLCDSFSGATLTLLNACITQFVTLLRATVVNKTKLFAKKSAAGYITFFMKLKDLFFLKWKRFLFVVYTVVNREWIWYFYEWRPDPWLIPFDNFITLQWTHLQIKKIGYVSFSTRALELEEKILLKKKNSPHIKHDAAGFPAVLNLYVGGKIYISRFHLTTVPCRMFVW